MSNNKRVVVAMSGGVDSSAAACMLHHQGYDVIGISMQVWDYRRNCSNGETPTCCSPQDFNDARKIAAALNFPFYVFDFEENFYDLVIAPFISAYQHGETPNPCVDCNRKVKFSALRKRALTLGTTLIATGHYAQIKKKDNGLWGLFTGKDAAKDQSYFLYNMTQDDLAKTLFPVGGLSKTDVRAYLRHEGFDIADKGESQDICFISSSIGAFIERETGKSGKIGPIVDLMGRQIGEHRGIYNYTIGQRKGLNVSHSDPLYVLEIDAINNKITVGGKKNLKKETLLVKNINWISGTASTTSFDALCKLRYRNKGVICNIEVLEPDIARLTFIDEWTTVSPGQSAVFYSINNSHDENREVIGGGIITADPS